MELNARRCKDCIQTGIFDVDGEGKWIQPCAEGEPEFRRAQGEAWGRQVGKLLSFPCVV
jgi:hypothetical protein